MPRLQRSLCTLLLAVTASWCGGALAASPALGSQAPDFRLQDQSGTWHTPAQYRGRWLVLYFYLRDHTPGCTVLATEFTAVLPRFTGLDAAVVGISVDDVASHASFARKLGLTFPILADDTHATAAAYDVLAKPFGLMAMARRETYVIDPEGRVVRRYLDVRPEGHAAQVFNDLQGLVERRARR